MFNLQTGLLTLRAHPTQRLPLPYVTKYGGTSVSTVTYRPCLHNISMALHRVFCAREPALPGYCAQLYWNQGITAVLYHPMFKQYAARIAAHFPLNNSFVEEVLHYADPHPKRRLRIRGHLEALRQALHTPGPRVVRGRVVAQLKVEQAKGGKKPRLTVDIGVMGSLVGAWLAKRMKSRMAEEPFRYGKTTMYFIPDASYQSLKRGFEILYNPHTDYALLLFSDDAALAIRSPDGVVWYDIDISSCDKSHTVQIFRILSIITPPSHRHELAWLIAQLTTKLQIRHPNRNRRERLYATPREATLYSGSVLTTLVNNVAVMLIGLAIEAHGAHDVQGIVRAAESVGYIVTVKEHHRFEQVQFLKHSPARDTRGEWQPLLNLGVFARACGRVNGELPMWPGATLRERAEAQQGALLKCMWPNTHFPALTRARAKWNTSRAQNEERVRAEHYRVYDGWPELHFTDASVLRRYGLDPSQASDYFQLLSLPPFYQITGPAINLVLQADYELSNNQTQLGRPQPLAGRLPLEL